MNVSPQFLSRAAAATFVKEKYGIRCSKRHLANLASNGCGPAFHKANRDALYSPTDLDAWAARIIGPGAFMALEHSLAEKIAA
jgi:hypothetical protein